jgi:hypothetical protein
LFGIPHCTDCLWMIAGFFRRPLVPQSVFSPNGANFVPHCDPIQQEGGVDGSAATVKPSDALGGSQ